MTPEERKKEQNENRLDKQEWEADNNISREPTTNYKTVRDFEADPPIIPTRVKTPFRARRF